MNVKEPNPFNKPRKCDELAAVQCRLTDASRVLGGVIVEQDENARLVAKPYNVAEATK